MWWISNFATICFNVNIFGSAEQRLSSLLISNSISFVFNINRDWGTVKVLLIGATTGQLEGADKIGAVGDL